MPIPPGQIWRPSPVARRAAPADCNSVDGRANLDGEGKDSVALKGGGGTLKKPKPLRTVGSYWPHATTTFDYVRRAMPFDKPGTLSDGQVYSLTAYVLYVNGLVKENEVIDAQGLPKIRIPTRDGFVADPQPDVSSRDRNDRRSQFVACRGAVKRTMDAARARRNRRRKSIACSTGTRPCAPASISPAAGTRIARAGRARPGCAPAAFHRPCRSRTPRR
jgi:hypothetical protein